MRKFLWVPVIDLSQQAKGQFLEIMSESSYFGGINMDSLNSSGLSKNTMVVKVLLNHLSLRPKSATLNLTNFLGNISNPQGINLGLLLACFLQEPTCPYYKIIVTGQLSINDTRFSVNATPHFGAKISAILTLGKQPEPTAFIFPRIQYTESYKPLLSALTAMNIVLRPIDTLFDALMDFGLSATYVA